MYLVHFFNFLFVLSEVKDYIVLHALNSPLCSDILPTANLRKSSVYTEPQQAGV